MTIYLLEEEEFIIIHAKALDIILYPKLLA